MNNYIEYLDLNIDYDRFVKYHSKNFNIEDDIMYTSTYYANYLYLNKGLKFLLPNSCGYLKINNNIYININLEKEEGEQLIYKVSEKIDYFDYVQNIMNKINYKCKYYNILDNDKEDKIITIELDTLFENNKFFLDNSEILSTNFILLKDILLECYKISYVGVGTFSLYYKNMFIINNYIKRKYKIKNILH